MTCGIACAPRAQLLSPSQPPAQSTQALGDVGALVALLPAGARRCVAVQPARVGADQRALVAAVSQAPALPWSLALPVSAYARAEVEGPFGRRESIELVRFVRGDAARIRAEITRADGRPLVWEDAAPGQAESDCADDLSCAVVGARFLDARTVQLSTPTVLASYEPGGGPCGSLLRQAPEAIEVAARSDALLGSAHVASESLLYGAVAARGAEREAGTHGAALAPNVDSPARGASAGVRGMAGEAPRSARPDTLVRVLRHRFQDEASAAQALERALSGEEDAPSLASSLVDGQRRQVGEWVELRSSVTFEELALGLADQERLRSALRVDSGGRSATPLPDESDAEAVRAFADAQLTALAGPAGDPQRRAQLDDLLQRALGVHPDDDGLSKRLFELRVGPAAAAALELADQALGAGRGELAYWQLARRRALVALSAKRYRAELQKSFGLSARSAAQMAEEVARKLARGQDHERAEWAYLTARNLCRRGQRAAVQRVPAAPRLPLAELPRLLVYLARLAGDRDQQALGVHILARGSDAGSADGGPDTWSEESAACAGHGRVLAAASFDDAPLLMQGSLLTRHFPEGELELLVAIDPLEPGAGEGPILRMRGRVAAGSFSLQEVGRTLREVRWPLVERYLLSPLASLRGSLFPPDEWAVEADTSELAVSMLASARVEGGASCASDGRVVRCRGSFSDPRAASRALRRAAFAVLAQDSRALWSGAD